MDHYGPSREESSGLSGVVAAGAAAVAAAEERERGALDPGGLEATLKEHLPDLGDPWAPGAPALVLGLSLVGALHARRLLQAHGFPPVAMGCGLYDSLIYSHSRYILSMFKTQCKNMI